MRKKKKIRILCCLIITCLGGRLFSEQLPDMLSRAVSVNSESELNKLSAETDKTDVFYTLYRGIALHNICRNNEHMQEEAVTALEAAYESTGSPIALGYLGSVITTQAGTKSGKGNFIAATADLSKGTTLIDQAVEKMPDSSILRFLRIFNSFDVSESSPLSRIEKAREDIEWLDQQSGSLEKNDTALLYLAKGKLALAGDDYDGAFEYLEKALATAPGSSAAKQADELLWFLEE